MKKHEWTSMPTTGGFEGARTIHKCIGCGYKIIGYDREPIEFLSKAHASTRRGKGYLEDCDEMIVLRVLES